MEARGWTQADFVCVTGDAYVDHPSFGLAVISRLLAAEGYKVCILAQPDWKDARDFKRFGRPRLGFLITSGNIDSMVNNYSAAKKPRRIDVYSPGGAAGNRPDRAAIVYAARAREAYKGLPIVLGGLEASLRRLSHYDYWSDRVRRSIILDAKADLVVYGMAERAVVELARRLAVDERPSVPAGIRGTVIAASAPPEGSLGRDWLRLPSFEETASDRAAFVRGFKTQYDQSDPFRGIAVAEPYSGALEGEAGSPHSRWVVQHPPQMPLSQAELDRVYDLPYARTFHPDYQDAGGVPAVSEVRLSITSSRGCFGGCSFCSLTFHQGRIVTGRSHESILREAETIRADPTFAGYIHDVGGPTANFRGPACAKQAAQGGCPGRDCLFPGPCAHLEVRHDDYLDLLRKLRKVEGVKKVFVRSGFRFDYLMADPDRRFLAELCEHHVSGQLKVAPEHVATRALEAMRKPPHQVYRSFEAAYAAENRRLGKKQYLVPYFISGHPGSDLAAAIELAEYFRDHGFVPDQVQDFYPTPGTPATCMFHTGVDPATGRLVHVPKTAREKAMQRALLHYRKPTNHRLVREALAAAGRTDLIGFGPKCLVRPGR